MGAGWWGPEVCSCLGHGPPLLPYSLWAQMPLLPPWCQAHSVHHHCTRGWMGRVLVESELWDTGALRVGELGLDPACALLAGGQASGPLGTSPLF